MRIFWVCLLLTVAFSHSYPEVRYEVIYDKTKEEYLYTYEIVNSECQEKIVLFSVYPLAPLYDVNSPEGWSVLVRNRGRIVWTADGEGVKPGESLCCFSFRSKYDRTLSYSEIRGERSGFIYEVLVPGNEEAKVAVEINPVMVNLRISKPRFLTLYIRIPPELKRKDIDLRSLFFQGAEPFMVRKLCDDVLVAKIDPDYLLLSSRFTSKVYLWGKFRDGTPFLGSDSVRVEEDRDIQPSEGRKLETYFRVSSDFSLKVDKKECRVDLTVPREAHRALTEHFGKYEIYTDFPVSICKNFSAYVRKNVAPWVALGDINGDGRRDAFLRILAGKGKVRKVVELFLVSSGDTYEVHRVWEEARLEGKPMFFGIPEKVLSPCGISGVSGTWGMEILLKSNCVALSLGFKKKYAIFYYIYLNGRVERIEYVYEP